MTKSWVAELWQYRELLYFFVWRDLKVRYKQTMVGVAWAVLQPLLTTAVFWLLFSRVGGLATEGVPYPLFAGAALIAWTYFSSVVGYASNSLVGNTNLLTKVYFPRATLPVAAVVSGLPDLAISSLLLGLLIAYYRIAPTTALMLWPALIVLLALLALGVSLILAALNVRYRDVKYAVPFMLQLWMFLSPVIYPSSLLPEPLRMVLFVNPLTGIIEGLRGAVFPTYHVPWPLLGVSLSMTGVLLVVGAGYFRSAERSFADVI